MSAPVVVVEVRFTAPGGERLARHLRDRLEGAVAGELAELSELERMGLRVTSRVVGSDGVDD
jgi:hypothetical protein